MLIIILTSYYVGGVSSLNQTDSFLTYFAENDTFEFSQNIFM